MRPEADYFRQNNFDLLRLVAATQVALLHGMDHLGVPHNPVTQVLAWLPGVPAFFFISGFLISASKGRQVTGVSAATGFSGLARVILNK